MSLSYRFGTNGQLATLAALALVAIAPRALAQYGMAPRAQPPPDPKEFGITQRVDAQVPLDLVFRDEQGNAVKLGDFINGQRPVILTLVYFGCPLLCGEQLNGLLRTLKEMPWTAGNEFEILTVSFEPLEQPGLARVKKENYLAEYGRPAAARGWHFLTGDKDNIAALTGTVGFGYKWNPAQSQWAHSSALILLTPGGRVARYLGGLDYDPRVLRASLVEASEGKVGSLADQLFSLCYSYDPNLGKYTPIVRRITMFVAGGLALVFGGVLTFFWRREFLRSRSLAAPGPSAGVTDGRPPQQLGTL